MHEFGFVEASGVVVLNRKRWKIAVGVLVGLLVLSVVGAALALGPLVRSKATSAGARYGANVEIGSIAPHWKEITLRDVRVTLEDVPSATIEFPEIDVSTGTPRRVRVPGGKVIFAGEPTQIAAELGVLRERIKNQSSAGGDGGGTEIDLAGLAVELHAKESGLDATLEGVKVDRGKDTVSLGADTVEVTWREKSISARGVRVELDKGEGGKLGLKKLTTDSVEASIGDAPDVIAPSTPAEASGPNRFAAYRDKLASFGPAIKEKLPEGASLELHGVAVHLVRGKERLNVGPGTLLLKNDAGKVRGSYESGSAADGKTLLISTEVPMPGESLAVDVKGGPISLSTLGIKDGDFKLFDVASATVTADTHIELSADAKTLKVSGSGTTDHLSFNAKPISSEPISGLRFSFRGKSEIDLDGGHASVDGGEIEIGALQIQGNFDYRRLTIAPEGKPAAFKLKSTFEIPLTACQTLLDAAPQGLLTTVKGVHMAGSIALKGRANFDTTNLDKDYDLDWVLANSCRITDVPAELNVKNFTHSFKRKVLTPNNEVAEIFSGPGSGSWAGYGHISKFMEVAVMTSEDGRFRSHNGFDHEAIKNSIRENLRTGKFVRGASTISMQTAKNLYLTREKTMARKVEEAILTMYLEQALTKEQIMELYLNVVELGPMVYGVAGGANHYFRTSAAELSLSQAFYLASLLPNPKIQHIESGNTVSHTWMAHLRLLMKYANKRNHITDDELDEGLGEIVVIGSPTPMHDPSAKSDAERPGKPSEPVMDDNGGL